jgi:hypothetical protein
MAASRLRTVDDGNSSLIPGIGVGIVDNRKLPGAQPVEGAAKAIVDVIENPRPEAYTSPFIADVIARYLREPEVVEAEIAARPR